MKFRYLILFTVISLLSGCADLLGGDADTSTYDERSAFSTVDEGPSDADRATVDDRSEANTSNQQTSDGSQETNEVPFSETRKRGETDNIGAL